MASYPWLFWFPRPWRPRPRPPGKCGDDFNGSSLGAQWTFLDKDGEPGGSAVVSGGKLALTGKGSDVYGDVNEFVGVALAPEAGNFEASSPALSLARR